MEEKSEGRDKRVRGGKEGSELNKEQGSKDEDEDRGGGRGRERSIKNIRMEETCSGFCQTVQGSS